MYRESQDKNHNLSELEIYKEIKLHVTAREKELNYAGARTIPMTVGVGMLLFIFNQIVFDRNNKDSVVSRLTEIEKSIIKHMDSPFAWVAYIMSIAIFMIPYGIIIAISISMFTSSDRKIRKKIYKFNIMNQIVDEKIKQLEKKKLGLLPAHPLKLYHGRGPFERSCQVKNDRDKP